MLSRGLLEAWTRLGGAVWLERSWRFLDTRTFHRRAIDRCNRLKEVRAPPTVYLSVNQPGAGSSQHSVSHICYAALRVQTPPWPTHCDGV